MFGRLSAGEKQGVREHVVQQEKRRLSALGATLRCNRLTNFAKRG
jgi:hypothetical protein